MTYDINIVFIFENVWISIKISLKFDPTWYGDTPSVWSMYPTRMLLRLNVWCLHSESGAIHVLVCEPMTQVKYIALWMSETVVLWDQRKLSSVSATMVVCLPIK